MNQEQIILEHLKKHKNITTWESFELYGITRLSAKIYNLKKAGYNFSTEWIKKRNRYGRMIEFKKYILDGEV
jgi:hypothetical protein